MKSKAQADSIGKNAHVPNEWILNRKYQFYDYHLFVALAAIVIVFALWVSVDVLRTGTFLYSAIGSVLGISYSVAKQRLEEIRLLKDLFVGFNDRYGKMNKALNDLTKCNGEPELDSDEKKVLEDYFNLCAEEFFYYSKGFVYPSVWHAWCHGMKIFADTPRIRAYWKKELNTNSYYGFSISYIENTVRKTSHGQH